MTDIVKRDPDNGPVRVLHVFGRVGRGGAESRTMELYRLMDRSRVQFDFLVHTDADPAAGRGSDSETLMASRKKDDFDEEITTLGGRIYALPRLSFSPSGTGLIAYRRACRRFFSEHGDTWRIVQGHMTSTAAIYLAEARRAGASCTIAHARSAGTDPGWKGMLTKLLRLPLTRENYSIRSASGPSASEAERRPAGQGGGSSVCAVDLRFACSHEAARAVFGKAETVILPNAVCIDRFRYDAGVRRELRESLGLGDSAVIGHVGSFRYAKNHEFLLRVFARLVKETSEDIRLLLVGDGTLLEEMKRYARSLGIGERVIFAGNQSDVWRYYQAMDILAFPSRYEGLPGTVVEAQTSGLPCLISDRITKDVDVTALVERAAIGKNEAEVARAEADWAGRLRSLFASPQREDRAAASAKAAVELKAAGFDAESQAKRLQEFYCTGIWK